MKLHLQTTIWTLLKAGSTQRQIERQTGISRHTIRAYKKKFDSQSPDPAPDPASAPIQTAPPWPPTPPPELVTGASICEPYRDYIEAQLRLKRNGMAIYQDLVDQFGFTGAYNSVKRFVAKLRFREPEQFDRLEFSPGEEMQVDYGEGALTRVPGTTRYRKPRLFVATLRYSRRSFRRVVWKSSQENWARLHEQAWRYFGGSCRYVVLDNLKEGVLKPDIHEPELNPVFAAMLKHYEVVGDPARVRDPNRKGTVENAIGHTQATALKGRRFETIEEQNDFLEHWEVTWAATRIHGIERRQVQAMFEEEKPHLQALPILGMQYFTESQRTVYDDRPAYCSARLGESAAARFHPAWHAHNAAPVCVAGRHGDGSPSGRFAALCRSARPRRYRDAGRQIRSVYEFAVELRLGKKSAGQFQDFIGTAQFLDLAFKGLDAITLVAGDAFAGTGINLTFFDPFVQGLGYATDLGRYGLNGCPQGGIFTTVLLHHAHCAFPDFGGKLR